MKEILENPVTGETIRVLESSPEVFKMEFALRPHARVAGTHVHPGQDQRLSVEAGTLVCLVDGETKVVRAGESVLVPAGTRHDQANPHDVPVRAIEEYRPAGRIHDFFRVYFGMAREGLTDRKGVPSPLLAAALFAEFRDSVRPGPLGLRILIAVLSPLAALLGHRRRVRALAARSGPSARTKMEVPPRDWGVHGESLET